MSARGGLIQMRSIVVLLAIASPAMAGELEAVIVPAKGYDLFLPEGDPIKQPPTVGVSIALRDAATHQPSPRHFKATLTLDTSHLPGACVNGPRARSQAAEPADLYFDPGKNPRGRVGDAGTTLALADGGTRATISSRDWGGFATLHAHVVVDGGVALDAVTATGDLGLPIPKDDNANHVADYWEVLGNVRRATDPDADDEVSPPLAIPGDGIGLADEYRGFFEDDAQGKRVHVRLNPNQRDVFVSLALVPATDRRRVLAALATWGTITNAEVHLGEAPTALAVKLDRPAARTAVTAMICVVDPACTAAGVAQGLDPAQRKLRADWAKKHVDDLADRYLAFVVLRDLGRVLHAREPSAEPTCPMHAWETDPTVADFIGGVWDLTGAPGGKAWRWCDDQMRLREPP